MTRCVAALLSCTVTMTALSGVALAEKAPATAPTKTSVKPKTTKATAKGDDAKRAEARKSYAEAEAKFASGDFATAYTSYKAANDLLPAPQTLYKMAVTVDKQNRPSEAIAAYQAFLSASPPASMDAKVKESEARVAELKKSPASVKFASEPAGATVLVDGAPQTGTTPLEAKLSPGHHKVKISAEGHDAFEKELDLEPASTADVTVTLTKSAPPPVAEEPPSPPPPPAPVVEKPVEVVAESHSNTAAYVLLGVAGAGAVVGTIFGIKAIQSKKDFNDGMKTPEKADDVEKNALVSDMAFGAALTLGVTGVVLLLGHDSNAKPTASSAPSRLQVLPIVSRTGAGAGATLRF